MSELDEPLEWQCSMCSTSITITSPVVMVWGEHRSMEKLETLMERHFDAHCRQLRLELIDL